MIEVRHPRRPSWTDPDGADEFWATLVIGALISCVMFGLLGAVVMDALYFQGPGMDTAENSITGPQITGMLVGAPVIYMVLYLTGTFLGPRVWPSAYVHTKGQKSAVISHRGMAKAIQEKSQGALDAWLILTEDDPQYYEARDLYSKTVEAARRQEMLLARQHLDLSSVKHNLESLQETNKTLGRWEPDEY